jgi:hypothetical protein
VNYIRTYNSFKESIEIDLNTQNLSDLLESLTIFEDSLLSSIKAEKEDIVNIFDNIKNYKGKVDIDNLSEDSNFMEALSKLGLRKSNIQNTSDFETFLGKPLKFMPIFKIQDNDLMNPTYILIQSYNDSRNEWDEIRLYKVNDDIKKFYDKLSSKTIEIIDNNTKDSYIYITSNSGNDWELKNLNDETDIFKRYLQNPDLENMASKKDITVNII